MEKMTELKTLKDLKFNVKEKDKDMRELIKVIQDYFHKDLKQEAIKWVKHFESKIFKITPKIHLKTDIVDLSFDDKQITEIEKQEKIALLIAWTKHFFNLTEEDLK